MAISQTSLSTSRSAGVAGHLTDTNTVHGVVNDLTTVFNGWATTDRGVKTGALVFNVKDYSATGDGVTDDTTPIQNAINAANAAGGGVVLFPGGSYAVTVALTVYSKVTLQGVRGQSKLLVTGSQTTAVTVSGRTSPSIRDLIVDGNASTSINQLVFVSAGSGLTIERCQFTNVALANSYGVLLSTASTDIKINYCDFSVMQRGVGIVTACERVAITNSRFTSLDGFGTYGISSAGSVLADILIQGNHYSAIGVSGTTGRQPCYFTGGAAGVYALRIRILNNVVIGNGTHFNGGTGNGDMIAAYNMSESEVANNTVLAGGDVGISVWRARRVTVTGNVCGHNNTNGIALVDSTDCTVTGNVCYSNRRDYGTEFGGAIKGGIRAMTSSTGNTITGNRCFNDSGTLTQDYGLVFESGNNNNMAVGNLLAGNATGDLSDLGTGNATGAVKTELFTGTGTWTKPVGAVSVQVRVVAAAGGGGGGRRGAAGTVRCGGGGGGGGGVSSAEFAASSLTGTVAVTIGAAGTAGAAAGADNTDGGAGGAGGTASFGAFLRASGGGGGGGGTNAAGTAGAASSAATFTSGGGGSASGTGAAGNVGSSSAAAGGGGGAGGGITTGDATSSGGTGAAVNSVNVTPAGTGGTAGNPGTVGTVGSAGQPGQGSGGGGSNSAGAGGAGAVGAVYGGGAGGGGASLNGSASGAGGVGGAGCVVVVTRF